MVTVPPTVAMDDLQCQGVVPTGVLNVDGIFDMCELPFISFFILDHRLMSEKNSNMTYKKCCLFWCCVYETVVFCFSSLEQNSPS